MAPNGAMQVWSGLLLRAQNEAQLAFVIGHELGHFQKRHALTRWRTARDTSSAMAFLTIVAAGAGVGFVGSLAQLAALSAMFAYSRDQEREADEVGFRLMERAQYDPREAARIWRNLVEESRAYRKPEEVVFFATHPSTQERIETLEKLAEKATPAAAAGARHRDRYAAQVGRFRPAWIQEEIRKGEYKAELIMLDQLAADGALPGGVDYFKAEVYRARDADGDPALAAAAYERAIACGAAPAAAHRSLGMLYRKAGNTDRAMACFERYLRQAPDAGDAKMIRSYLEEMR
jgi:predicted Zn-dependent protease